MKTLLAEKKGDIVAKVVENGEVLLEFVSYQADKYARTRREQTGRQNVRHVSFLLHCRTNAHNVATASDLWTRQNTRQCQDVSRHWQGRVQMASLCIRSKTKRGGELSRSDIDYAVYKNRADLRTSIMLWRLQNPG